ncbi:sensor histidine kinase [Candidatus Thioglobus autotrophicus]|uniref:sensor histidine kinase n=1 Tax=Candidatus Thioglobus autotrophicus TaxID=1705394 RepID=UPI00299F5279|nr:sensor histidine kinase [Candidatus Thioglobus autotrophicus]WPE18443.1 sensor histidine kinase [Candidatus Thioglobus autotrophicus]
MSWYKFITTIVLLFSFNAAFSAKPTEITIAIQSFLGKDAAYQKWQSTADYLSRRMPDYSFNIIVVDAPDDALLYDMVRQKKVDYVITQPIASVELNRLYNTSIHLTKIDQLGVDQLGGVIFTSVDNHAINNVEALKGNSFAASTPKRLGGWVLALDYLRSQGIDPEKDFSRVMFLGSQDNIVNAVVNGLADAGTVRTGVIEKMIALGQLNRQKIKILNQQKEFPYSLTTKTVPEWSFSSLEHTDTVLRKKINQKLLSYQVDNHQQWKEALNYEGIRTLIRKHRIGIYQDPAHVVFYKNNYQIILIIILLSAYLIMFYRNQQETKIRDYKSKLEALSKVSSVDQLLSEVAHELSQPITSLKIDAHMLANMLKDKSSCELNQVQSISNDLREKTDHCVDLILNIRQFLSKKTIAKEVFNANINAEKITRLLKNELRKHDIHATLSLTEDLPNIEMSSVELDQVLLNLSKNAISAMKDNLRSSNTLSIGTKAVDNFVEIRVGDTGFEIKDKNHLFDLFKTSKEMSDSEGLGIGLSLSRRIVRSYAGELLLESSSAEGSSFIVRIPRFVDE